MIGAGPNELTIFAPNVLPTILEGPHNPFSKPAWYDNLQPYIGLTNHRDRKVHDHHRRVWDHGFTTQGKYLELSSRLALTFVFKRCSHTRIRSRHMLTSSKKSLQKTNQSPLPQMSVSAGSVLTSWVNLLSPSLLITSGTGNCMMQSK